MDELTKEIIKAFAYGYEATQISTIVGVEESKVEEVEKEHSSEIEEKKEELKEGGWC